jgi:ATP-binding cassette, subfamily B, multidrug efflux pump
MIGKEGLSRLLADIKPAKSFLLMGIILYFPITILSVIQPVIIGYAVQHGMLTGGGITIFQFGIIFISAVFLLAICELIQGICLQTSGQLFVKNLRKKSFLKIQNLSMGFLDSTPLGKILTRLVNDAESVVEMFSMGAVQILSDCLFLIGTFIMLLFIDVNLTFYSALILPFLVIGIYFFRLWTKKAYVRVREILSHLNSFLQEYLSGIVTVQVSNQLSAAHDDFSKHNQLYLFANRQAVFLDAAIYSFVDALSYLASALVLYGAFNLKFEHALSLGVLVAFLEALSRFFQPVRELSNRYAIFQSALVSLERIYNLYDWPEEIDHDGSSLTNFCHQIEFRNVSFSYKFSDPVLKNISFTLKKNQRIALIGHTGAGKSTVIKLINRFYPVNEGEILLDGRNINHMQLGDTRRLISVVPQEVFLFAGSLRENLVFGNPNASDAELWHALELVQLSALVREKGGLNAKVSMLGQNFSAGERQLIAIARAWITKRPVLILDEATASVDIVTENRLQLATKKLLENSTALVIAHRLSTIMDADNILVFHRGEIVEQGKHTQLMKQNGMYANYVRLQRSTTGKLGPTHEN